MPNRDSVPLTSLKIVSGGQTGADRAALDAALNTGVACGGWCPKGRKAEDGPIPARYPLNEMPTPSYPARTRRNVLDSDATLIVSFGPPDGGTALTVTCCRELDKPHLIIDAGQTDVSSAAGNVRDFVLQHGVRVLNVAGPRVSKQPGIHDFVYALVSRLLG